MECTSIKLFSNTKITIIIDSFSDGIYVYFYRVYLIESKIAIEINNNNINDTRNACYYFSNPKYFPIELETLNMRRVTVCNALCVCAITVNLQIMKKRFYGFCESMYSHTQFKAHSTGLDLRASKALIHSGGCE